MRTSFLRIWIVLAILAVATGAFQAQTAGQGIMLGTWTLNVAKSNFGGGPKLMAMTVKVASDTPELIQFTVDQTTASGFAVTYGFKGAPDGKDYPLTGSSSIYSYTEEPGVVHETQKDTDGTVTKGDFTVSTNGKVGTWNYTITNPDGSTLKQKLTFDHST